jgi:hypothetical protein
VRKTSLPRAFDDFNESLQTYAGLAGKIASSQRVIRYKWEKTELLEAFALRLVTLWEVFVEDVVVACLNRDTSKYAEFRGLVLRKHLSADECRAMLTGLGYFDCRSVGEIQRIGKQVLVINPFAVIPKAVSRKIDELMIIRNYLAHYSRKAKRALERVYRNTYGMQRFREPGDFLWADTQRGGGMRFYVYLNALRDAASAMRTWLAV